MRPLVSIVTPSLNQAKYLESTIQSVLQQDHPGLEYVVIDGGSSDGSLEIIQRYQDTLAYWASEPDGGQYDAINKGFAITTGEIMAWLNSDDMYTPWALSVITDIFLRYPEIEFLTSSYLLYWNEKGQPVKCTSAPGFDRESFYRGANLPGQQWYARSWIQQESTFWRRSLWERAGGYVDASLEFAGDFELWARFLNHADLYGVKSLLGGFRIHSTQKTALNMASYITEARQVLMQMDGHPYSPIETGLRKIAARATKLSFPGHHIFVRLLVGLGLMQMTKSVEYLDQEWRISHRPVV